ncbi:MAG: YncE family protein [Planctomycetota bacterium]
MTEEAAALPETIRHGFRYDPMKFVEEAEGLEAALVRKLVFGKAKEGDGEVIQAEIDKALAEQRDDGALGENPNQTADKVLKLLSLGCPPDRPEVARALDSLERAAGGPDVDRRRVLETLLAAGRSDRSFVKESLKKMAQETVAELGGGCPGTPYAQLRVLWLRRDAADVSEEIGGILEWLEDAVEPPGCSRTLGLCYIWGIFETLGEIDHPAAARITAKLAPIVLRAQGADGGWRDCYGKEVSLGFFSALKKHGLLEPLRQLPPLPPDWRIARSIPAPGKGPKNIGFAHGHLWVLGDGALTAVSEEDGSVIKTLKLEGRPGRNHFALAEGDGSFWLSAFADKKQNRPAAVVEFDAETGKVLRDIPLAVTNDPMGIAKVGSKLLVGDGWAGAAWLIDLEEPGAEPPVNRVAASMPDYMSSHGDDIWCVDWFSPSLVRTNMAGDLVDWGERPFGFEPVAFDGENLWALDSRYRRVCMLEKSGDERVPKGTKSIRDDLRNYFNYGRGVYPDPGMADGHRQEWARILGLPSGERLRAIAEEAGKVGCTQETLGDAVLWLSAEGSTDALIMMVDKDDIRGMRRFMDLLAEAGSPLAFIIIRCDGYYDVLSMQPDWYIRHNNQPRDPDMKLRPPCPGVREDLHDIDWKKTWPAPEEVYAAPLAEVIRAHAELAAKYGCTQSVDDGILLWRDEDGKLAAMLCVCEDTDLPLLRRLYARIEATDCPLTWLFLRLTHWEEPVFDILSMSRRHYMAHRNRIGDWHKAPRPFRREAEEDAADGPTETF